MAQVVTGGNTGLAPTNPGGSIREDLINFITTIAREETPFLSSIGTTTATNVIHEWLTDDLANPRDNAANEGAAYAASSVVFNNRVRKNNYAQIFRAELGVSGTAEAVDSAGVGAGEYAYQLEKNAKELKRDIERQYVRYQGTTAMAGTETAKSGDDPRRTGSIFTWARLFGSNRGSPTARWETPAAGAAVSGGGITLTNGVGVARDEDVTGGNIPRLSVPGTAATGGLIRDNIEAMLANMYEQGTRPNMIMTSPTMKTTLSQLFSDANTSTGAQRRMTAMEMKLNIAVTAVMTDFGFDIALVPNYQMGAGSLNAGFNHLLFYQSDKINRAILRPFQEKMLDDQGDGRRGILLCEEALEVRNPKSVGVYFV